MSWAKDTPLEHDNPAKSRLREDAITALEVIGPAAKAALKSIRQDIRSELPDNRDASIRRRLQRGLLATRKNQAKTTKNR